MSEFFGPDFWETNGPDGYDWPVEEPIDESTVDPVEIDASEDGATSGEKMKIGPLGSESPSGPFGNSCDDCSGSCWLTCSGSCKYSYTGTMN